MSQNRLTYRGSEIVITQDETGFHLTIDGQPIKVEEQAPNGPYWTIHTPFVRHQTVLDLAKAVIDHRKR